MGNDGEVAEAEQPLYAGGRHRAFTPAAQGLNSGGATDPDAVSHVGAVPPTRLTAGFAAIARTVSRRMKRFHLQISRVTLGVDVTGFGDWSKQAAIDQPSLNNSTVFATARGVGRTKGCVRS